MSLPKDEDGKDQKPENENKIAEKNEKVNTNPGEKNAQHAPIYDSRQTQSANFSIIGGIHYHKSPSPPAHIVSDKGSNAGKKKLNKPVIAKDNFVLAH